MLVGLISPFTLMAKLSQGSSQLAGVAQLVEFQPSKLAVESSNLFSCSKQNKSYIGRVSTVERDFGSHRIATFTESNHAPKCHVMVPALRCTRNR